MAKDIDPIMQRAANARVDFVLNICTDSETLKVGIDLAKQYPWLKNAGATTPHDVEKEGESNYALFAAAAERGDLCAVGETGLDYHYQHSNREIQVHFLKRYLALAKQTSLPVIFHCREAFSDLFAIVDREYPKTAPAVVHCFTGSLEEAREVIDRGWFLSLSGIVTFKKSVFLREVAKYVPLGQLLIETDAPYLAPQSQRGKMNEPAFIVETARCIAETKGISLDEVAEATLQNGRRLFLL